MNINELNRIKTVNVDAAVEGVVAGSGTYKEILDKVMANEIIPIVTNSGTIVGISYDSKVENLIDDNIAQVAFEKRYRGINVMRYVLSALELKANGAKIADVQEDGDGIRVILENGEVVSVVERMHREPAAPQVALPSEAEIPYSEYRPDEDEEKAKKAVLAILRNKYDHYLSGEYQAPDVTFDAENEVTKVTNIHWGRKR